MSVVISVFFLALFLWCVHSLSKLRLQMDEVIERLKRIEGRNDETARSVDVHEPTDVLT